MFLLDINTIFYLKYSRISIAPPYPIDTKNPHKLIFVPTLIYGNI